ncbi:unnamed protein product [[Actinomadura] parvosata subsp. kistnae]|nr:hypothetical protein [Nonomuraea sp. ATCC 55076]SPL98948.1 unnamed protein product [Actinomadura parvosata subsp. kistnae]
MAVLLSSTRVTNDPLSETYFVRAADALGLHRTDGEHACVACAGTWPCPPALAAAFMLDLHTS